MGRWANNGTLPLILVITVGLPSGFGTIVTHQATSASEESIVHTMEKTSRISLYDSVEHGQRQCGETKSMTAR
ncbi:hypothetical protein BD626DRAFT_518942 [Schizophyllum amplum]|uniref:Uncharacterized protein n=1 Tax=Schizophyllum amplum TaxID=97359 RepID=A0A550BVQ3_9AGAR|nr:hypothetical protein BD626DRAFT_518942 [Auriculariopsis ampla]